MNGENTNWSQSVAAVCIREGKVLLARHSYGRGSGKLIIPGGYVNFGESPQDAVRREFLEETGVAVEPGGIVGIRFNTHDWYVVFAADYVSGEPRSDGDENTEVVWMDADEALGREDVPELTKTMLRCARSEHKLAKLPYSGANEPNSLFGAK